MRRYSMTITRSSIQAQLSNSVPPMLAEIVVRGVRVRA